MSPYEQKILQAFKDLCAKNPNGDGASPAEVTKLLAERNQISPLDTVLDIADLMRELRNRGDL